MAEKAYSYLKQLEGKQTIDSVIKITGLKKTSALNVIADLKKRGHVRVEGGGKQKRIYTFSSKILQEQRGMFSIINTYAKIKIIPPFQHVAHGKYQPENALIDAILLKDFRVLQASLYLFNHLKNWSLLYELTKKHKLEPIVGALYDFTRTAIRTKRMPMNMKQNLFKKRTLKKIEIIKGLKTDDPETEKIAKHWNVIIPFSKEDKVELS